MKSDSIADLRVIYIFSSKNMGASYLSHNKIIGQKHFACKWFTEYIRAYQQQLNWCDAKAPIILISNSWT